MGIPHEAFRAGDLYIEYGFEHVLFRYEKETSRFFRKFYSDSHELEIPHDSKLLCEARCSGVLTTAERYSAGGAPDPVVNPTAGSFSRTAAKYERTRPYWLRVTHQNSYTRSGDIEVGADGCLEVIEAVDSIKELLEMVVSEINCQPRLTVTCADGTQIAISKKSRDFDFGLRLELKNQEFTVVAESSYHRGRSDMTVENDETKLASLLRQAETHWTSMGHQVVRDSDDFADDLGKFCNHVADSLVSKTLSDADKKKVWTIFAPTCQWDDSGGEPELGDKIFELVDRLFRRNVEKK